MPQNIYLLDGTMKNNIALGVNDDHIDTNLLNQAIELSDLKNFIDINLKGSDLLIGENGNNLSGGQIQRLGIARALYKNPSIIILDEATSALDEATENKILDNLFKNKECTIVTVSHRKNSLKQCNKIFEITNNSIEEISLDYKNEKNDK